MTIYVFGLLGQEYGETFESNFDRASDIIKEMCSKLRGFKERVLSLMKEGFDYTLIKHNGKWFLTPVISGSGWFRRIFRRIGSIVAAVGIGLATWGIGAAIVGGTVLGMSAGSAIMLGASLAIVGMSKPKEPSPSETKSQTSANSTSNNLSLEQTSSVGQPIPVGYGMMLVAGTTIYSSIQSIEGSVEISKYLQLRGQ